MSGLCKERELIMYSRLDYMCEMCKKSEVII